MSTTAKPDPTAVRPDVRKFSWIREPGRSKELWKQTSLSHTANTNSESIDSVSEESKIETKESKPLALLPAKNKDVDAELPFTTPFSPHATHRVILIDVESCDSKSEVSEIAAEAIMWNPRTKTLAITNRFHRLCHVSRGKYQDHVCIKCTGLTYKMLVESGVPYWLALSELKKWIAPYIQQGWIVLARDPGMEQRTIGNALGVTIYEFCDALIPSLATRFATKRGRATLGLPRINHCGYHQPIYQSNPVYQSSPDTTATIVQETMVMIPPEECREHCARRDVNIMGYCLANSLHMQL